MTAIRDHLRRLTAPDTALRLRPLEAPRGTLRAFDHLIGFALAVATLAILLATPHMGFTRDEGFYFHAAKDYIGWFNELEQNLDKGDTETSFTQENIDKYWSYNAEHPVLVKTSFALSYRAFAVERDWLAPSTAMRLPTMVFVAVLIWLMYLFMAEAFDRVAGAFACLALMTQPRFFFHAHLACFDAAMATMWFAVIWAYWKSLGNRLWVILAGVVWGLALGTKLNAFFIPGVLLLHWALNGWADFSLRYEALPGDPSRKRHVMLHMPRVPAAFFSMILLGSLLFYLLWPRHWYDTFPRIYWYFDFHLSHEHYAITYFGDLLAQPPFPRAFPYVMSLVTVPVVTLVAFVLGIVALASESQPRRRLAFVARRLKAILSGERVERDYAHDPRGTVLLMALACWIPFFVISRPNTPVFGGTKHWATAMPFLACFAGIGFSWALSRLLVLLATLRERGVLTWLRRPVARAGVMLGLTPVVLWPAVRDTAYVYPLGTSYYNELIGSYIGAADAGMQPQFWGQTARFGLDYLNEHAPPGALVHLHDTLLYSWDMYQEDGLARKDLRVAWDLHSAHYVLYHHERAFHPFLFEIWSTYGSASPVYVVNIDGVPMLSIYENPRFRRSATQSSTP